MVELKRLAKSSIPLALEKALRYRLLNEPRHAESICLDVLAIDPNNQSALKTLVLALSDRFGHDFADPHGQAKSLLEKLEDEYDQAYYEGIIHERWGKAQFARGMPGNVAAGWLREAMRCYARAETVCSQEEPDAVLRWNTCARLLAEYDQLPTQQESAARHFEVEFNDDVPMR
jgi:hypothetical protein